MEVRKLCAILGGENLKGILVTLKLSHSRMVSLSDPEGMAEKLRDLRNTVSAPIFENSLRSYQFLLELSRLAGEEKSSQMPLSRAVSLLESNFQEDLQIPEIASRAGVSERTLRRLFRNELKCSPLEYLNQVRLKIAAEKLQNTGLRIKEIAQRCGFVSPARFCTVFQEKYRMTPGDFRKRSKVMTGGPEKGL
jgi:transcriptional regulator GlxA family with amidase domain